MQRVAIGRALVRRPKAMLMDEPIGALDAKLREEMQSELRQIQRSIGTTTILVTHDQHEAMALSDLIVLMNQGRIEQIGAPHEVYDRPASAFVASFLGKTNVLAATGDGQGAVNVGGLVLPLPGAGKGPLQLAVRPERLMLAAAGEPGLEARITGRVFQGAHWQFSAESAAGALILMRGNDGAAVPGEGETVRLRFSAADAAILPAGAAA